MICLALGRQRGLYKPLSFTAATAASCGQWRGQQWWSAVPLLRFCPGPPWIPYLISPFLQSRIRERFVYRFQETQTSDFSKMSWNGTERASSVSFSGCSKHGYLSIVCVCHLCNNQTTSAITHRRFGWFSRTSYTNRSLCAIEHIRTLENFTTLCLRLE